MVAITDMAGSSVGQAGVRRPAPAGLIAPPSQPLARVPPVTDLRPGPGAPTPPIALAGDAAEATARLATPPVDLPGGFVARLEGLCAEVTTDLAATAEASRDWWPLAMVWATEN